MVLPWFTGDKNVEKGSNRIHGSKYHLILKLSLNGCVSWQPETLKGWFIYIYMCVCVYMGYQPKNGQHLQCRNSTLSISFWKLWDLSHHYNYRRLASCEGMFTIQELRQLLPHRPVAFGARRTSQFQHMWHVGLSYNGATLYRWMVYNEKSHENGWFRGNPILGKLHMPPY